MNTQQQNSIWKTLFKKQLPNIEKFACKEYLDGLKKIEFTPDSIPTVRELNKKITPSTGWRIEHTIIRYLSASQWITLIGKDVFPITTYLRSMEELDFTPEPDMFHDILGHLPFLLHNDTLRLTNLFASTMANIKKEDIHKIANLWWFTIEFGLINEGDTIKAFGAGLMSSFGEIQHALDAKTLKKPFSIRAAIQEDPAVYSFHNGYFVINSVNQLIEELNDYFKEL